MKPKPSFSLEPWHVREESLNLETLAETESLFALANGHLGWRANLDEGEPFGLPGTYLNSFYELRPLPSAEPGYGDPESGQSIINVTNGKIMRLLVDDEPFDVRYGELEKHERVLDLQAGTLHREVDWISPAGQRARINTTRLVSLTQRAVAAILYEVQAVGGPARVVIQSELVANEPLPQTRKDPRVAQILDSPLESEQFSEWDAGAAMVHHTNRSQLRVAAAMDHIWEGPESTAVQVDVSKDISRVTFTSALQPGEKIRIVKFVAYGWSGVRSRQALFDQVTAALTAAKHTGWEGLVKEQRTYLDDYWENADIEIEGDPEIQQAVRLGLFHVLQAGARAERRPIGAKGLTGVGYEGHTFWDTDTFVLPVLIHTVPKAAGDVLRWRHATLDAARRRAQDLGIKGAAFPWRTIAGEECSGYWPAGTAAFHINADIAYAVTRYLDATEDERFERDVGVELLVETARLWVGLGHFDREGKFRIDGITGPDEYAALADNNVYTNLMAQHNLRAAADAVERQMDLARALKVREDEPASWRAAAEAMYVPYDETLRVHPQSDGYTLYQMWDFTNTDPSRYPLLLHYPYFELYRKQVVKQADLILAMHLRHDYFDDPDQKERDFAYYERITVRDSSLSAAAQAVIAAELGYMDLAYDYLAETALVDIANLHNNTSDGIHLASMAGTWNVLVAGFGGLRVGGKVLAFSPRLPEGLTRLAFNLCYRDRQISVVVLKEKATYMMKSGEPITISHHGEEFELVPQRLCTQRIPPATPREHPTQPPGREPLRRGPLRRA
ncbi:MAG TPA: glycosyl hydrolase family 65 protein [Actinomycetota bacterium]|nr:glycosyl hydrolase family 65 protein [Actinomycetota bacterium]